MSRNDKISKREVIEAGYDLASRATQLQQENHWKVIAWIETLPQSAIPDYASHSEGRSAGAMLSYKMLIRTWLHNHRAARN